MKFLLYLKSWKLFLIFITGIIIVTFYSYTIEAFLLLWTIYIAWVYHIGVIIHGLLPCELKPKIGYFKFNCLFLPFVVLFGTALALLETIFNFSIPIPSFIVNWIISIIFLGYWAWCWLYISMYAGRMLESVIEGQLVNRSDALKAFVCFLAFPYGVWYIQPAVQRVLKKYEVGKSTINN